MKNTPFTRAAERFGYRLKRAKKHLIWEHIVTGAVVVTPKSASDYRAIRNACKQFEWGAAWQTV